MAIHLRSTVLLILIVSVLISRSAAYAQSQRPKNVQVSLRAKWPGTPILLEAGELLSNEWKDLYWDFMEAWLDPAKGSDCSTARCCVKKIVDDARSFLSEDLGSIFEFSLTLRSASPKLVLYRQLAEESLSSFPVDDGDASEPLLDEKRTANTLSGTSLRVPGGSCCWVDTGNTLLFNASQLLSWLDTSLQTRMDSSEQPELFYFDHVYGDSSTSSHFAILYGALGTECFRAFHHVLAEASKKGAIKYIVRPVLPSGCLASTGYCSAVGAFDAVNLGGYGVELALKNMEYKAMDDTTVKKGVTLEDPRIEDLSQEVRGFIFSKILERKPEMTNEVMAFRDYLLSSTVSDTLEVWELKDLGHQTAQRIVQSSDPLHSMQEISQNFPSIVSSLSRMKLNDSIKDEIISNQRMVPPGKSLMALNGALINIDDLDLYQLVDLVHEELSLADQFSKLKLPQNAIQKILSVPPPSESNTFRVDFRSPYVFYLNNLEEDAMYKRWRSNINEILMPVFPGQLRYIRKNIFHAVYVLDPATACGAEAIESILSMYQNNVPMRFGVLLYSSKLIKVIGESGGELPASSTENGNNNTEDVSSLIIQLFLYITENYNNQLAFHFLSNVNGLWAPTENSSEETLELQHIEEAFVDTLLPKTKSHPQEILLKLEKESKYKEQAMQSTTVVYKLGLSDLRCCLLMNGLIYHSSEEAAMNAMNEELPKIQEEVYFGHINSNTDILERFLSGSGYKRYNPQIIGGGKSKKKFISLVKSFLQKDSLLHDISYLHSPGTMDDMKPVTHILAVNLSSRSGLKLLQEGIRYMIGGSEKARMGFVVHVDVTDTDKSPALLLAKVIQKTVSFFSRKEKVLSFLEKLCLLYENHYVLTSSVDSESVNKFVKEVYDLAGMYGFQLDDYKETPDDISLELMKQKMKQVSYFLQRQTGLELGCNAVITNGRIIIPSDGKPLISDDFRLLESVEYEQRIKFLVEIVEGVEWADIDPDSLTSKFYSDLIMSISSLMSTRERSTDRAHFEILNAKYSAVVLNNGYSSIHIDAVIDPLSPSSQKLSALLRILWKYVQPTMRIVLNPISSLADLPLKNYYRFVVPSMDDFSATDYSIGGPRAFFSSMPLSKTLTMNLDVPEPWLVEPVIAVHDLDNILLENLGDVRTLQAVFELEALLLTGHCSEKDHDPPRGLQLILGTKQMPHIVDTLVMANLGYWQMKVSPGVWYLQLAPGRSADIYMLRDNDNSNQIHPPSKTIVISDLRGKLVHLEVEKKKGKEREELLNASDDRDSQGKKSNQNAWNSNIMRWASGFIGSKSKKPHESLEQWNGRHGKPINIFSIASGHLYERFLKIMILTVLKNTQRPVKFWFIKNYLSPQFKDVIPHMAKEYGFEYELITYKWPTWLHKQKEKQRIIWAYKILFLDVIFPLSLEKVIFVDADQVVRADMGELYDMDLKGRPLAYTPFCDNNKDMDGYRFWKHGFWKDHLRGRPYHISALYVVDLARFRQTAAGDTLRIYYENLSKDPNSLSNLDQDLPNYAQHTVPIFSLPQEWLWCESWCGNATKSKAKTIDLCNNPMTKEPKLQGARRIVPEWVDLDMEASAVTSKILGEDAEAQEAISSSSQQPEISPSDDKDHEDVESRSEL